MSGFVVIAGLLTLAALVALLFPLLRRREGSPEAWRSAGLTGVLLLVGCAALYPVWSNYEWHQPEPALDSPQAMVGRLARRLEREPEDLNGWLMLGRSYAVIGQFDLSARAYQRADTLARGQNSDALIGLAESLVEAGRSDLAGRAGRLFEQALQLDDTSTKAWFYGALAARERNELPLARERFMHLLRASPPPEVAQLIEQQVRIIEAEMALSAGAPGAAGSGAPPAAPTAAAPSAAVAAVAVPLRVTLAPELKVAVPAGARLFVLARLPEQRGGPPLAVKLLQASLPQDVVLLSTDAMMGGNGFSAGQELEIEARIALSGGANSRSGDPFGVVRVKAGGTSRKTIAINQIKP